MSINLENIYAVVCERDVYDENDPTGKPIVFEQSIDPDNSTLENVYKRAEILSRKYGECKVVKLIEVKNEQ